MGEVVSGLNPALVAGNTAESLAGVDRDVAAASSVSDATGFTTEDTSEEVEAILDEENTFDVSRKEFGELQEAFVRLVDRINKFNTGSPHKI